MYLSIVFQSIEINTFFVFVFNCIKCHEFRIRSTKFYITFDKLLGDWTNRYVAIALDKLRKLKFLKFKQILEKIMYVYLEKSFQGFLIILSTFFLQFVNIFWRYCYAKLMFLASF